MNDRLKIMIAGKQKSSKWLAERLKKGLTVSKWATNIMQPDVGNPLHIAEVLNIDVGNSLTKNI